MSNWEITLGSCLPWLKESDAFSQSVSGITLDSRNVQPGYLFLAVQGLVVDGRDYVDQAIQGGAKAVFVDSDKELLRKVDSCWVISVPGLAKKVGHIASLFYGNPSSRLTMVGVTGTNGKTTVAQLIAQAFHLLDKPSSVIGTAGNGLWPCLNEASHTTPDAVSLQGLLASFERQNCQVVSMEVSSHGLDQGRTDGVEFDVAVFTNLTRDHLDYHGSMKEYGQAKAQLFRFSSLKASVINLDDVFSQELLKVAKGKVISYSQTNSEADIYCRDIDLSTSGMALDLVTPLGSQRIESSLIGRFNVSNLLAVISVLYVKGMSLEDIKNVTKEFKSVSGRMEVISETSKPTVVVDYAHTGDALEKALASIKSHCSGSLYCVFGCGGDRDRGKRPQMASIAEKFSDHVVLTNDNPRSEDPEQIINNVMSGFAVPELVHVEKDRAKAIKLALKLANPDDWVLVAGKGHENYQEICGVRHEFSDVLEVKAALMGYQTK